MDEIVLLAWQQKVMEVLMANPDARVIIHIPPQQAHVLNPKQVELIQAAFAWREELIPNTSTTTINAVNRLSRALDALTEPQEQS